MAITINGNGTVTGISVGGLPDGIVDTDMIAANAVIGAKLGSRAIINISPIAYETNSTTVNNTTSNVGALCSITRKSASSNFLILMIWSQFRPSTSGWARMSYRRQVNSDTQTSDLQLQDIVDEDNVSRAAYLVIDTTTGSVGDVVKIQPRGGNSVSTDNQFSRFSTIIFEYEP